jgi:hypothetical protein
MEEVIEEQENHEEYEFYGYLSRDIKSDENKNGVIDWVVANTDLENKYVEEIEDGDFLEVYDSNGKLLLSKIIYRDYDTFYNKEYKRQLYRGMAVRWVPEEIALDYWINLFNNNYRARIFKEKK